MQTSDGGSWVAPVAAQDCYNSSILKPTPFMGNNGEIFQLADGSVWEVKYEYEYLLRVLPIRDRLSEPWEAGCRREDS